MRSKLQIHPSGWSLRTCRKRDGNGRTEKRRYKSWKRYRRIRQERIVTSNVRFVLPTHRNDLYLSAKIQKTVDSSQNHWQTLGLFLLVFWSLGTIASAAERRLNIVFILADDLGWRDLSNEGSTSSGITTTNSYSSVLVRKNISSRGMTLKPDSTLHSSSFNVHHQISSPRCSSCVDRATRDALSRQTAGPFQAATE